MHFDPQDVTGTAGTTIDSDADLQTLLARLADNKYFLGKRYAEWCTSAPSLESAVAAAAMAQDEIGHARSLYPLLRDVAGASAEFEPETRTQFDIAPFLSAPFQRWPDFVAANFLFDTALSVLLESARASSLQGLAQRARRILEEETLHWLHGCGWTRRLGTSPGGVQAVLIASFHVTAPEALACFGAASNSLVGRRVVTATADQLRNSFRTRVNPVLESSGLPPV